MRNHRRAGQLAVNGLLAIFSVATVLLVLELGARGLRLNTPFFLSTSAESCLQRSSLLSFEFRPSCTGVMAGAHFRTNSLGLRSPELRDDGSVRILAIGDSCTWGWGMRDHQPYPIVLQRLLDRRWGRARYQVINAGVPGSTSYQGMMYLRERGLRLQPAIVLAGYGFNDLMPGGDVETQIRRERTFMPLLLLDDFLVTRSAMYRWLRWQAAQGNKQRDSAVRSTPRQYGAHLRGIVEAARERGVRIVLLGFWHPNAPKPSPYPDAFDEVAATMNVPVVRYGGPLLDVVHPTAAGYRLLAQQILDRLIEEKYLP